MGKALLYCKMSWDISRKLCMLLLMLGAVCANVQAKYIRGVFADGNGYIEVDTAFVDIDGAKVEISILYGYDRYEQPSEFSFNAQKRDTIKGYIGERLYISKNTSGDYVAHAAYYDYGKERKKERDRESISKLAAKFVSDIKRLVNCCIKEITVDVGVDVGDVVYDEYHHIFNSSIVINIKKL